MPRTKVSSKIKTQKAAKSNEKSNIGNLLQKLVDKSWEAQEETFNEIIESLNVKVELLKLTIKANDLNKTIGELRDLEKQQLIESIADTLSVQSILNSTSKKTKKSNSVKRSLSCADDEGYRTAESNEINSVRSSGRRSRTKQIKPPSTRKSRSLSRNKTSVLVASTKSHKTPAKQKIIPDDTVGTVTPKYKPNTPQVLLRRPKQGEVAISLQGSPLLVNNVQADQMANINIPLDDGRMFSIQPQRGLRVSQIPDLDEDVRRQIDILRDNLNKVLSYRK